MAMDSDDLSVNQNTIITLNNVNDVGLDPVGLRLPSYSMSTGDRQKTQFLRPMTNGRM